EFLHRSVSPLWFLLQGHQYDVVEVTLQATSQLLRLPLARLAHQFGRNCCTGGAVRGGHRFHTVYRSTELFWLLLTDGPLDFRRRGLLELIGPVTSQQFVEHNTQRINVGGGGNNFTAHLLWTRIRRGHTPSPRLC